VREIRIARPPVVQDQALARWLDKLTDTINGLPSFSSATLITSSFTPLAGNMMIYADASASTVTVNLPSWATMDNTMYWIKKVDASANGVVVDPVGAVTIDGAATLSTVTQYVSYTVHLMGGNFYSI
jgi:hypothetical protein